MGRGRAKAKQAKVARQLKYSGGGTDLDRLRAELGVGTDRQADGNPGYPGLDDSYSADDDDGEDESCDNWDEGSLDDDQQADSYEEDEDLLTLPGSGATRAS
jgi:Protein of unknown function (DUF3073)